MRIGLAMAGAACLAGLAAPAAAQDYVADRVVRTVGQKELLGVVGSLGHQVTEEGGPGEVYVAAEEPGGTIYLLIGTACNIDGVEGCQGIMMQVRYDLPPATTVETLAAANMERAALSVWADFKDKVLGFTRYQVLDGGVTMANIRENVIVLLDLAGDVYPVAAAEPAEPARP